MKLVVALAGVSVLGSSPDAFARHGVVATPVQVDPTRNGRGNPAVDTHGKNAAHGIATGGIRVVADRPSMLQPVVGADAGLDRSPPGRRQAGGIVARDRVSPAADAAQRGVAVNTHRRAIDQPHMPYRTKVAPTRIALRFRPSTGAVVGADASTSAHAGAVQ